ncbi:hypothetical protein WOLCODRAFT_20702 [Wolfiporia cocos MD-104 SS10]|uniref:Uncharacterized protein n=1 Tax=Wolfiporia cocos (strain MD-104) TaxID=742152 RepID=A0A2H3J391_WOLCO|nr:hypothetical protein WOLCODRAFT_20702 [Wolfiporia cocos MD-104 SS10]
MTSGPEDLTSEETLREWNRILHAQGGLCHIAYGFLSITLTGAEIRHPDDTLWRDLRCYYTHFNMDAFVLLDQIHAQITPESYVMAFTAERRIIGSLLSRFVYNMRQVAEVCDVNSDTDNTTIIVIHPSRQDLQSHTSVQPASSRIRTFGAPPYLGDCDNLIFSDDGLKDNEAHAPADEDVDINQERMNKNRGSILQNREMIMDA